MKVLSSLNITLVDVTHDRRGLRVRPGVKAIQFAIGSDGGRAQVRLPISQVEVLILEMVELLRCARGTEGAAVPAPRDIRVEEVEL